MKPINWVRWLLACCVCTSVWSTVEARYKFRYPQPPMYKKSWPIGPRISMGNSIHINVGPPGYKKQNRPPNIHKQPIITNNYNTRYQTQNPVRRPPPMFAVLPSWKSQPLLGAPVNQVNMGQRGSPPKEYHSMSKLPEYSPEYRPEQALPSPPNRGELDDDKGPIHTIPAPNLSPADKPYNIQSQSYSPNIEYSKNLGAQSSQSAVTNYLFGTLGTSLPPAQRITPGPTSPTPTGYYEVTETNEVMPQDYRTLQPAFMIDPDFDGSQNFATTGAQTNDIFATGSNTGLIGTNIQFGAASNSPMQTNLQSSLHVGFPASASQASSQQQQQQTTSVVEQQTPELHVGHPAPAGPPLSANQLYDLLNSFPQQLNDQYNVGSQQQQVIQQQLDQIFQSSNGAAAAATTFSQPQMHSFNYDEQSNKQQQQQQQLQQQQQQQQIFVGQDYASSRVTADYSLEPEIRNAVRNANNQAPGDNSENNIEYNDGQGGQSTFLTQIGGGNDGSGLSSQFYTTLPSRDAAEKLAALAAAGNVNSHLMGQLRKQQADFNQDSSSIPTNHKDENYNGDREEGNEELRYQQQQQHQQQQMRYVGHGAGQEEREDEHQAQYQEETEDKRPLRIMVPDLDDYSDDFEQRNSRSDIERTKLSANEDYEYEDGDDNETQEGNESDKREIERINNGNGENRNYHNDENLNSEFGSRLTISDNN